MTSETEKPKVVVLGSGNIGTHHGGGKSRFLEAMMEHFDVVFITPEEYTRPKTLDLFVFDEMTDVTPIQFGKDFPANTRKPKPYWRKGERW